MKDLDPLKIPLRGLSLIEASAGTGKTYSIATLYLRLLLERRLEVDRILVVTFTEAATEELRERVRKRVAQALEWLQGDIASRREQDSTLAELLLSLSDRDETCTLLTDALTRMDEAAIHTIHGFCLRTLQENAFESGAAFDVEFITNETQLRVRAVEDFWRSRVACATPEAAQWVLAQWATPEVLLRDLEPTLNLDDLRLLPEVDEAVVEEARRELGETLRQLRTIWTNDGEGIVDILESSSALNRRSYNKSVVAKAVLAAEYVTETLALPDALPDGFERLTPTVLEKGTKADRSPPEHAFFDLCGRFSELLSQVHVCGKALFLTSARQYVREALSRRKQDEGLWYYDDLLRRLDLALGAKGGEILAAAVRERYPVALIDEFQDTDPQQYRIFRRIYSGHANCGLFLIGDPKQAIYAFRGADIFTYMRARDDSDRDGSQYSLGVNWRSSASLIKAVNHLFGSACAPFIYERHIGFYPVDPSPNADEEPLRINGTEPVPVQFWMHRVNEENQTTRPPGFIRRDAALDEAAQACAENIAGLLNLAGQGRATIGDRTLRPGDIALLVRTHREGDIVQQALRSCGISSVSLSQESVFATEDAEELVTLLEALATLHDEGCVRAALATSLLGRSVSELERHATDELDWEELLRRFQSYAERWKSQGVMVAMQELLAAEQVPARLLRRPDGERRLTNLLQLLELLQVASGEHPGQDGLLRWLADQRANAITGSERDEAQQLRLESDEGLVKVVTLHKSKGLEYPLVYIPFPWSYFRQPGRSLPTFFHMPEDKIACLDLGSEEQQLHRTLERTEQLAERLRLFYVGVTRAAKLCVLCWGKVNGIQDAALAYLLHRDPGSETPASRMQDLSEAEIRADLQALADGASGTIEIRDLPIPSGTRWVGVPADLDRLRPREFASAIDASWRVSSYSALVRGEDTERPDYDASTETPVPDIQPELAAAPDPIFELPAGTHAGHFLHEVLETLDFPAASGEALNGVIRDLLERYGQLSSGRTAADETDRDWTPVVAELVTNVLDTWLDSAGTVRLRDVAAADRISELEFHFPIAGLDPKALRRVLALSPDHARSADGLGFEPMRGLMRGFIDLVFRANGRFYIVDYKSNRLGDRLAAYEREGLRGAVHYHHYDLQYLIYTLALHRFLQWRLPDYDYERHFGGVYYLFLRGMRPELGSGCGIWYDRPSLELIQALDQLFEGSREVA